MPATHSDTGVNDRNGTRLFVGDRVRYCISGPSTKEEYWNPEYEVIWEVSKFTLKHVGGGRDGGSHDFILTRGGGNGYLELIQRAEQKTVGSTQTGRERLLKEIEVQIAAAHGGGVYSAAKCLEDCRAVIRAVRTDNIEELFRSFDRRQTELLEANNGYLAWAREAEAKAAQFLAANRSLSTMVDDLGLQRASLRRLMNECADKLERAIVLTGTTQEYAAIAVAQYRMVDSGAETSPTPPAAEAPGQEPVVWFIGGERFTRDRAEAERCRAKGFMIEELCAARTTYADAEAKGFARGVEAAAKWHDEQAAEARAAADEYTATDEGEDIRQAHLAEADGHDYDAAAIRYLASPASEPKS